MNVSDPTFFADNWDDIILLPEPDQVIDNSYTKKTIKHIVDDTGEFVKGREITIIGNMIVLKLFYDSIEKGTLDDIEILIRATRANQNIKFKPSEGYPRSFFVTVCKKEGYRFWLEDDTHMSGYIVIRSIETFSESSAPDCHLRLFVGGHVFPNSEY